MKSLKPQEPDIAGLFEKGLAHHQQGQLVQAKAIYEQVLAKCAQHFDAMHLLGVISAQTGLPLLSIELIDKAIKINPDHAAAHSNRGNVLLELKHPKEALLSFDRAIAIEPGYAQAHYNRGNALLELKRLEEALASYERAIAIQPDYAPAHSNRGNVLLELKRTEEALASHDRAIVIKPDYAPAHSNRGKALVELRRTEEALTSFDLAIAIKPDFVEAHSNRGHALLELKRPEEALASLDRAIAIEPDFRDGSWNKSLALLLVGRFEEGWALYESRWKRYELMGLVRSFAQPLWLGSENLVGKTILLHAEQGMGDTIQFCRYVPLVAQLGAAVILGVQRPLLELLKDLEGVSQIVTQGDALPAFDYHCPLMSLPLAFKTEIGTIPAVPQSITSDRYKVALWQSRLGQKTKPRVGLVWSGSTGHKKDRTRSLTLSQLLPYLPSHIDYVCLQKEVRDVDKDLLAQHSEIKYFGDALDDFTDTSALIESMDLVISVDTSVAHLAGTLRKPTWVLLPFSPDWRWLLDRDDSPWYPTVTLYRQEKINDWDGALERLKGDLELMDLSGNPA